MTEYHPPMTGVQSHFEDEIAPDAQKTFRSESSQQENAAPSSEKETDRSTEEAMHLDQ